MLKTRENIRLRDTDPSSNHWYQVQCQGSFLSTKPEIPPSIPESSQKFKKKWGCGDREIVQNVCTCLASGQLEFNLELHMIPKPHQEWVQSAEPGLCSECDQPRKGKGIMEGEWEEGRKREGKEKQVWNYHKFREFYEDMYWENILSVLNFWKYNSLMNYPNLLYSSSIWTLTKGLKIGGFHNFSHGYPK